MRWRVPRAPLVCTEKRGPTQERASYWDELVRTLQALYADEAWLSWHVTGTLYVYIRR